MFLADEGMSGLEPVITKGKGKKTGNSWDAGAQSFLVLFQVSALSVSSIRYPHLEEGLEAIAIQSTVMRSI